LNDLAAIGLASAGPVSFTGNVFDARLTALEWKTIFPPIKIISLATPTKIALLAQFAIKQGKKVVNAEFSHKKLIFLPEALR
jgi:hypothetical protein